MTPSTSRITAVSGKDRALRGTRGGGRPRRGSVSQDAADASALRRATTLRESGGRTPRHQRALGSSLYIHIPRVPARGQSRRSRETDRVPATGGPTAELQDPLGNSGLVAGPSALGPRLITAPRGSNRRDVPGSSPGRCPCSAAHRWPRLRWAGSGTTGPLGERSRLRRERPPGDRHAGQRAQLPGDHDQRDPGQVADDDRHDLRDKVGGHRHPGQQVAAQPDRGYRCPPVSRVTPSWRWLAARWQSGLGPPPTAQPVAPWRDDVPPRCPRRA
jgi:hypothetical protein